MPTDATSTAATGFPTYMPRLIQPPGGMPAQPENATLVQVGFNYGLNYPFVVAHSDSTAQIFAFLPQGIAHGLNISNSSVTMHSLQPFDTTNELKYVTTLANAYIPSDLVDQLQLDLHAPFGAIYGNPSAPVKTLMQMINPTIPIIPGANLNSGSVTDEPENPSASSTAAAGDGAPIGGDSGSSQKVRSSSVGIGVGAVAGAALYGAAMIYVARRYKKRRQNHQRAGSVPVGAGPEMSQRSSAGGMGGYFMSGANGSADRYSGSGGRGSRVSAGGSSNGRSIREQGISAPVMSENSLGWN
ncbi:hypothetical protein K431DRAFT_259360 [Polychaeton citri CBS 116435]|uniref:Uncharacterized protein n=1 Tax=Polychaeton citri CBS 116435 TaxID=1314669 RepID=A0A9P4QIX9_9PEZI|nr:hypothetical protein K431DRAFT_259360 [Polychaeton citri CBS 116435]